MGERVRDLVVQYHLRWASRTAGEVNHARIFQSWLGSSKISILRYRLQGLTQGHNAFRRPPLDLEDMFERRTILLYSEQLLQSHRISKENRGSRSIDSIFNIFVDEQSGCRANYNPRTNTSGCDFPPAIFSKGTPFLYRVALPFGQPRHDDEHLFAILNTKSLSEQHGQTMRLATEVSKRQFPLCLSILRDPMHGNVTRRWIRCPVVDNICGEIERSRSFQLSLEVVRHHE